MGNSCRWRRDDRKSCQIMDELLYQISCNFVDNEKKTYLFAYRHPRVRIIYLRTVLTSINTVEIDRKCAEI